MGIVNVTPDSFSDGGRFLAAEDAIAHAISLIQAGADILDIGGESTRPGASKVQVDEELNRVLPVIEGVRERTDAIISIDTTKRAVAEAAIEAGVDIVNDISGMTFEPEIADVVAASGAGLCLMHTTGRPSEMQEKAHYDDVIGDIRRHLEERVDFALDANISLEQIVVDAGFGFGKKREHNYELLARIDELRIRNLPVLIGLSRKRMIRDVVGTEQTAVELGTALANFWALQRGGSVLRVHDVAAAKATRDMYIELAAHEPKK
jgi:dihydropteroate synthase